jgi:hypothetical protein
MCFGSTTTGTQNTQTNPNATLQQGAAQSVDQAENLMNTGYQAYTGQRVADLTPLQQQGFGDASTAVNAQNPYVDQSQSLIDNYANAAAPTVQSSTIASNMQPYMNQYVSQALAPQEQAEQQQFASQDQNLNAQATSSGAFGDSRAGVQAANLTNQQDIANQGLIGQAYTSAFNTAIGAGAQDVSNSMSAQAQTGQFNEQQLANQLGGANALQGLYGTQLSDLANQYGLSATAGGAQQTQAQNELNVPYSNYLAAQQYPFLTQQNLNSTLSSAYNSLPEQSTTTTQQPNNAGYAMLGAMFPSLMQGGNAGFSNSAMGLGLNAMFSDERIKDDIEKVGELNDGLNVYKFRYKGDPLVRVGLMAQDVEKKYPAAVAKFPGTDIKLVNYDKATQLASAMGSPDDEDDLSDYRKAA